MRNSPPYEGGVAAVSANGVVLYSRLLGRQPHSPIPLLTKEGWQPLWADGVVLFVLIVKAKARAGCNMGRTHCVSGGLKVDTQTGYFTSRSIESTSTDTADSA